MAQRYKTEDSQCFKSKGAEDGRLDKFVEDCYAGCRSGIGAQAVFAHTHGRDLAAELLARQRIRHAPVSHLQDRGTLNNLGFFASYMLIYLQSTLQYNRVKLV